MCGSDEGAAGRDRAVGADDHACGINEIETARRRQRAVDEAHNIVGDPVESGAGAVVEKDMIAGDDGEALPVDDAGRGCLTNVHAGTTGRYRPITGNETASGRQGITRRRRSRNKRRGHQKEGTQHPSGAKSFAYGRASSPCPRGIENKKCVHDLLTCYLIRPSTRFPCRPLLHGYWWLAPRSTYQF